MKEEKTMDILDVKMYMNDAGAKNIREYLKALLHKVWDEEECFSGKHPFGNSSWQYDVHYALAKANLITSDFIEDELMSYDRDTANKLILEAIEAL